MRTVNIHPIWETDPRCSEPLICLVLLYVLRSTHTERKRKRREKFRYYRPQRSWGKVIFSQASVILLTGGVCLSACWNKTQPPPRAGTPPGAVTPRHKACWEIRSTRGRYAPYWNAILCFSSFSNNQNDHVLIANVVNKITFKEKHRKRNKKFNSFQLNSLIVFTYSLIFSHLLPFRLV